MFDDVVGLTTGDLDALVGALSRVQEQVDDGERIEQLSALERVKAAVAAAQARVTVGFVRSQEQIAQGWRQRSRECADAGDFDGWRQARENAARASLTDPADPEGAADAVDPAGSGAADQGDSGAGSRGRGSRRSAQARQGRAGVAAQVALARREAPSRGSQHVNLALRLVQEMPGTYAALASGVLSEWRAWLVVREAAVLTPELRTALDAELCAGSDEQLGRLGDRELTRRVKAIAYRLDPASVAARSSRAEGDRRVSLRPAPDTMAYLTALLPVAQAVAAHAALTAAADTARAAGDERGKGQVMADTLVERVTGQAQADAVPVEVQVVMSEGALFAGADTPAQVPGYGTVPAQWARDLLTPTTDRPADHPTDHGADHPADGDTGSAGSDPEGSASGDRDDATGATGAASSALARRARVWLRRLYAHPQSGALVAMDSTRRVFDGGLRRFLIARDGACCRTPWCDAPIRHLDHVCDHADGGPTTAENAQGLCVRCNLTKALPGWSARTLAPDPAHPHQRHAVELTTPTGHRYHSTAPPLLPGREPPTAPPRSSALERELGRLLAA